MKKLNLGKLNGPLLVFGGIYSNLQALEALVKIADQKNIPASNIICTGDIVAYCAQPEACVQMIRVLGIHSIAGNVEIQISTGQEDCACDFVNGGRCDTFSKQWYPFAKNALSKSSIDWMARLPEFLEFEYAKRKIAVVHGSYHHTSEFIFESTEWAVKQKNFDDLQCEVILAGHCGLPFSQSEKGKLWLNSGVIGMPANDGTPKVWYMILDDQNEMLSYQHLPLDYDHQEANRQMIAKDLTPAYAETLLSGIWDNCEILPPAETAAQGNALHFL